jgi:hypothetical protein
MFWLQIWSLERGIKFEIYPREEGNYYSRRREQEKSTRWIAMVDLGNSSSPKFMNSRSNDYNRCINIPFVHQSTMLEYHELIEDWDVDYNYDHIIPKWILNYYFGMLNLYFNSRNYW